MYKMFFFFFFFRTIFFFCYKLFSSQLPCTRYMYFHINFNELNCNYIVPLYPVRVNTISFLGLSLTGQVRQNGMGT